MFKLGMISKAHGTRGEVVLTTETDLEPPSDELLYLKNHQNDFIPVKIVSLRIINKNNAISFFVLFKGIADRSAAENLKGFELYGERIPDSWLTDETEPDVFDCTGYQVLDESGTSFGYVQEVIENPAHPLLSILNEDDALHFLVPLVDAYILEINHDEEIIIGQNLDLLTDL